MRLYNFEISYLNGINAGIQSSHAQTEMVVKYVQEPDSDFFKSYLNWAINHKTIIVLNGGRAKDLCGLELFLEDNNNPYPWASFREDVDSLNGCITNIGIIVPEKMYVYNQELKAIIDDIFKNTDITWIQINKNLLVKYYPATCRFIIQYCSESGVVDYEYNEFEQKLLKILCRSSLMN